LTAARIVLLMDACGLLNLLATDRLEEIALAHNAVFWVPQLILKREVKYLHALENGGRGQRVEVDLSAEIERGLIVPIKRPSDDEVLTSFEIRRNARIGPGEAIAIATAIHRGGVVVTDDRRAITVMLERAPNVARLTTSQVVRKWCEYRLMSSTEIERTLHAILTRSRFTPAVDDPEFSWWQAKCVCWNPLQRADT
jgi:predicted nucleic acid-binding protein